MLNRVLCVPMFFRNVSVHFRRRRSQSLTHHNVVLLMAPQCIAAPFILLFGSTGNGKPSTLLTYPSINGRVKRFSKFCVRSVYCAYTYMCFSAADLVQRIHRVEKRCGGLPINEFQLSYVGVEAALSIF